MSPWRRRREQLSAITGLLSAIDRNRCPHWIGIPVRFRRNPQREREHLPADVDYRHVWTILDCDGHLYLSPGFRFVNRIGYVLCAIAWTDEDQHQPDYRYD